MQLLFDAVAIFLKGSSIRLSYLKDNASVQDQPEAEVEDSWVCKICEVEIRDDNAKVMSCERCHTPFCCNCLGMNSSTYDLMNSRPDIHWFCIDCERQAMLAVKGDWEIEERCAKYLESMNQRFVKIEESLELKVDKAAHDSLATKVESLNTQLNGLCTDIIDLNKKFDLLHKEPQELEKRKNNLIIRGLENSDVDDDQLVRKVFFAISVADVPQPADVSRLGKNVMMTRADQLELLCQMRKQNGMLSREGLLYAQLTPMILRLIQKTCSLSQTRHCSSGRKT